LVKKILKGEEIDFIRKRKLRHQPPDLLVYSDNGERFFMEVKKDGDSLYCSQKEFFQEIKSGFGIEIHIVRLQKLCL
jgi:hypothetical protein